MRAGEKGPKDTAGAAYAQRLRSKEYATWKKLLDVQRPYRWNVRRQGLGRTLDVGCGIGRNLEALDPGSVGVDHNEDSVRLARARGFTAVTVREWQDSDLRRPEAFDGILLAHVIEHLSSQESLALLADFLPYLRPGGKVLFVCPQERGYRTDASHVRFTTGADLHQLAIDAGLEPEPWFSFPLPRWAGRLFTYNEFCLCAVKPPRHLS